MSKHPYPSAIAALVVVLTIAACSTSPEDDTPDPLTPVAAEDYVFPVELAGDYTVRWAAADGIDLASPEGTIVRAIAEAMTLSGFVGEELSYPGWFEFWESYNRKPNIEDRTRTLGRPGAFRSTGTEDRYLYKLEQTADGVRAEYCSDASFIANSSDKGESFSWYSGPRVPIYAMSFMVTHSEAAEGTPTHEPSGLRAPNWNVFEGWEAVRLFGLPTNYQLCQDWYQTRHRDTDMPEWVTTTGTPPSELPPVKPPHPGW